MLGKKRSLLFYVLVLALSALAVACGGTNQSELILNESEAPLPVVEYVSRSETIRLARPAAWKDVTGQDKRCPTADTCWASGDGFILQVIDRQVGDVGGDITLTEYIDLILPDLTSGVEDFDIVSRTPMTTNEGLPAEVLEFTFEGGDVRGVEQWLAAGGQLIRISYLGYDDGYDEIRPMAAYTFDTVKVQTTPAD